MAEGYVNLFENDWAGTNRPHFKGYIKIDGVDHEFALWPQKDGKKGYTGKYKPKQQKETSATGAIVDEVKKQFPGATEVDPLEGDKIPF